ncbi:MAG: hypothetical protein AAF944_24445, partial [Bacteroidota bacterium]
DGRQPFRESDPPTPIGIAEQAQLLTDHGIGPNVGLMLGHNTIRYRIMNENEVQRPATETEISHMKELIRQGMEAGAFGLSAGLEYFPGRWSTPEEVLALVEVIKPYGGAYIVHERSSGSDPMWYWPSRDAEYLATRTTVVDNIREVIEVARKTRVKTSATHVKVRGADYWGKSQEIIGLLRAAWDEGLDNLYLDQYPYSTTGSDGNTVLIPDWAFNPKGTGAALASLTPNQRINYAERLQLTLNDPANIVLLQQDIQREVERRGGAENILVLDLNTLQDKAEAFAPNQYSEGISEVMINGQWVVRQGEFTENLPGWTLRLNTLK